LAQGANYEDVDTVGCRCLFVCLSVTLVAIRSGYSENENPGAQTAAAEAPAGKKLKASRPRKRARGRLPNYYGKLELSDEQRNTVYEIQVKYRPQLRALQQQLHALRKQQNQDVEKVLTPAQKEQLTVLRAAAKHKRDSRKKPVVAPKP